MSCRCIPDSAITARDADTGTPQEWVAGTGFWGWLKSGWRDVVCAEHGGHLGPLSCSRCDVRSCLCPCHTDGAS